MDKTVFKLICVMWVLNIANCGYGFSSKEREKKDIKFCMCLNNWISCKFWLKTYRKWYFVSKRPPSCKCIKYYSCFMGYLKGDARGDVQLGRILAVLHWYDLCKTSSWPHGRREILLQCNEITCKWSSQNSNCKLKLSTVKRFLIIKLILFSADTCSYRI